MVLTKQSVLVMVGALKSMLPPMMVLELNMFFMVVRFGLTCN